MQEVKSREEHGPVRTKYTQSRTVWWFRVWVGLTFMGPVTAVAACRLYTLRACLYKDGGSN